MLPMYSLFCVCLLYILFSFCFCVVLCPCCSHSELKSLVNSHCDDTLFVRLQALIMSPTTRTSAQEAEKLPSSAAQSATKRTRKPRTQTHEHTQHSDIPSTQQRIAHTPSLPLLLILVPSQIACIAWPACLIASNMLSVILFVCGAIVVLVHVQVHFSQAGSVFRVDVVSPLRSSNDRWQTIMRFFKKRRSCLGMPIVIGLIASIKKRRNCLGMHFVIGLIASKCCFLWHQGQEVK